MAAYDDDSPRESPRPPLHARVIGHFGGIETDEAIDVRPFNALREPDFYADARQIEEWTNLNAAQFEEAVLGLQLKSLLVGIDQASDVSRELQHRSERATKLAGQLREAARAASDHGLARPSEF